MLAEVSVSGQVLPEEIDLPERAHDIQGQVFGALTVLRPVDKNRRGVLWLCECECGRHAIRNTASLRQAVKNNIESQCSECLRELRRGSLKLNEEWWHEFYLLRWYEHESLYTDKQLESMERRITEDLRELDFPVGEPTEDTLDSHGYDQPEPYGGICDGENHTLDEIGHEFGVSRERARQMVLSASRKLAHKHRRLLISLFTGEFDWRAAAIEKIKKVSGFVGCKHKNYDRSAPGFIYCRTCWQVWPMDEQQISRIFTTAMLQRATIFDEPEMCACASCGCDILETHYSFHTKRCVDASDKEREAFRRNRQWPHRRKRRA